MQRNVGGRDRIIRGVLGIWLAVVALAALQTGKRTMAAIAGLAGLGLLQNALTRFCGCNRLFGIDTTADAETSCGIDS